MTLAAFSKSYAEARAKFLAAADAAGLADLNRNFQDFGQPLPRNPAYNELAALLVPPQWPPPAEVAAALERLRAERGAAAIQTAITAGQHEHPQGLFYGGVNPTWSHRTLRGVLHAHATRCERLGWIDVHTGLGPSGSGWTTTPRPAVRSAKRSSARCSRPS